MAVDHSTRQSTTLKQDETKDKLAQDLESVGRLWSLPRMEELRDNEVTTDRLKLAQKLLQAECLDIEDAITAIGHATGRLWTGKISHTKQVINPRQFGYLVSTTSHTLLSTYEIKSRLTCTGCKRELYRDCHRR